MSDRQADWDRSYLRACRFWAEERSKDPSTKVGAVIVRPDRTRAADGYNGFPRGMIDAEERYLDREQKYPRVVHAEMNAILTAREPLHGYTLYTWPLPPCDRCAVHVIQAGIVRVVTVAPPSDALKRHAGAWDMAKGFFAECGVEYCEYDADSLDAEVEASGRKVRRVPESVTGFALETRDDWFFGGDR